MQSKEPAETFGTKENDGTVEGASHDKKSFVDKHL